MRIAIATAAVSFIALLGACSKPPAQPAPIAESADALTPGAFPGTPREAAAKLNESLVLRDVPQLASRNGPVLTIHYRGQDLVTYTDDPNGCARYVIERAIKVYDPQTGNLEPIALVACHLGATTNRYLVLPSTGKYAVTDDVAASQDGRFLATSDSTVTKSRGAFIVIDWPNIERRAEFAAGCTHIKWQDSDHLTADCWHSDTPNPLNPNESTAGFFIAKVWRDGGVCRMHATQWLQAETFAPLASSAPLPKFTAVNKEGVDAPA